jgi:hypothetical protein
MVIDAISGSVGCTVVGRAQPAHRTGAAWVRGVADLAPVAVAELDDVSPNGPDPEQSQGQRSPAAARRHGGRRVRLL